MGIQQLLLARRGVAHPLGVVSITNQLLEHGEAGITQTGYELTNLGVVNFFRSVEPPDPPKTARTVIEQWVTPADKAALYEVRAVLVSVTPSTDHIEGTFNAWLPLTTTYLWYVSAMTAIHPTSIGVFDVSIRRVGQTVVDDTARVEIRAFG